MFIILLLNRIDYFIDKIIMKGHHQKCLAELGRIFVRLEVGRLVADVIRFFTPL